MDNNGGRLIVITGGPGMGKTAIIEEMHRRGYAVNEEGGRAIIRSQKAIDGKALPWLDASLFGELLLSWHLRSYQAGLAAGPGVVFYDRGIPDAVGYYRSMDLPVPEYVRRAGEIYRYRRQVFITPPWREIYTPDQERTESFDEAVFVYECMAQAYVEADYEVIEVQPQEVGRRASSILEVLGGSEGSRGIGGELASG